MQVKNNQSDAVILVAAQQKDAQPNNLAAIVVEKFDDHFVIVTKKGVSAEVLKKTPA